MATRKIKDLAVVVGQYQSGNDTKNRYLNVGSVMETDSGGKFILLDRTFSPAGVPNPDGRSTVLISMFDAKDDQQQQQRPAQQSAPRQAPASQPPEDDIPF